MDKNQVYNDEMEQMRQDMSELRSLLSEQKIVNERLMRRAMKSELDKERRVTLQTLLPSLFTLPLFYFMQPLWGLPLWFVGVTIAYLLLAVVFSIWSVRRLTGEDLLAAICSRWLATLSSTSGWVIIGSSSPSRFSSSGSLASSTIVDKVWRKTWPTACYGEA